jgi:hypothetical protein
MAKGDKWEQQHMEHLAKYEQEIRTIYNRYIEEATRIASSTGVLGDKPFTFADYPLAHSRMKELQRKMAAEIKAVITKGEDTEWRLSEEKTIELINSAYGDIGEEVIEVYRNAYLKRRDAARKAFNKRRSEGLNLSNRVWQYTGQFKEELEMALDLGIREGKSADELSRDVRRYLNNPNMLFRRVRDEHGILHLSKRAKAYHPGQGVYRSSYKNARRLTATETNIAYRNAEQSAWQALDFVVGQKIQLSNNHTLNGEPFIDICDHLQGNYPKDFVFTGWHPLCRCFATAILMTPEERQENSRRRLKGVPPIAPEDSKNYVGDVPDAFKAWCRLNAGRVERAKSVPYFVRDNKNYYDAVLNPKKAEELTPLEIAKYRHEQRTPEQAQAIRDRWHERQERYRRIELTANNVLKVAKDYGEVDYSLLQKYVDAHDLKGMASVTRATAKEVLAMKQAENALADLIPNAHSLHRSTPMRELQQAYSELDGVMKNWLKKYSYSSLDNAPLDHLRNKLDFELNSTRKYTHSDIVKDALTEKIKLVDRQIEWNSLMVRANSLRSFKTRSSTYKGSLAEIEDAIKRNDFDALKNSIAKAEVQQQKLTQSRIKRGGDIKTALNKEYKGGVVGTDISVSVDTHTMKTTDSYQGQPRYTNNVARLQGFDSQAKLVSDTEFDKLAKANSDIFFRTVKGANVRGIAMTHEEFASQMYLADELDMNGPSGRVYGDGIYVATSAWNGRRPTRLTSATRNKAYNESRSYAQGQEATTLEMTWVRKPNLIKQNDLWKMWCNLTPTQRSKFGNHENTYGCALGYDGMYCDSSSPYMVIWNRSIIAVKR